MMQINLARARTNERAEQRSHTKHVFTRVLPVVAALAIAGNIAYHACFPRRVEITPDVCKDVPAENEEPDPERLALKAKEMAGCPPLAEIERRLDERGYVWKHLRCVGYDVEDGEKPSQKLLLRVEMAAALSNSELETIKDYARVLLESAKRGVYTESTDRRMAYALHSAIAIREEDEAKFENIRQMVIEYAGTRYDTYPNPLTEFIRNFYFGRLAEGGDERMIMYNVLLEAMLRCTEHTHAAEAPVTLYSTEGGMKANMRGACGFQSKASIALSMTLGIMQSMMGQEDAEKAAKILSGMDTIVVGSEYWDIVMKGAAGSTGDRVYLDARHGTNGDAWPYYIVMHEMMHYISGQTSGGLYNFLFNELITDALATRAITIQLGMSDAISERDGEIVWDGIYSYSTDGAYKLVEFFRLLALFEREMGAQGVMGAYMHGDLRAFSKVMESEYGEGAFGYVFGETGRIQRVIDSLKTRFSGGFLNMVTGSLERLRELREKRLEYL